jgi:hypothetical protein
MTTEAHCIYLFNRQTGKVTVVVRGDRCEMPGTYRNRATGVRAGREYCQRLGLRRHLARPPALEQLHKRRPDSDHDQSGQRSWRA